MTRRRNNKRKVETDTSTTSNKKSNESKTETNTLASTVSNSSNKALSISLLESSDEEENVYVASSQTETEAMKKAKLARQKLLASSTNTINIDEDAEEINELDSSLGTGNIMQSARVFENVQTNDDEVVLLDSGDESDIQVMESSIKKNSEGLRMKLKLRINGNDSNIEVFSVVASDPFQKLFDAFCRKKGATSTQVKFILDGDQLNLASNCQNEDLEGGEIVDVQLTGSCHPPNSKSSLAEKSDIKRIKLREKELPNCSSD